MAFVLPNLFTLSSVFCGFYAILLVSGTPDPKQFHQASLAIFFGMFFDMADGRIARMTRTQSEFGVQMDSLADVLTFGMAPAVIVHRWALARLGLWGALVAFAYVACGVMRLARFNVLAARDAAGGRTYFTGLPIPLAAGLLTSLVMVHQKNFATGAQQSVQVMALMALLATLMVSNIRYRTFKDVSVSRFSLFLFASSVLAFVILASYLQPTLGLLVLFSGYVGVGLVESAGLWVWAQMRRLRGKGGRIEPNV